MNLMKVIMIQNLAIRVDKIEGVQLREDLHTVKVFVGTYGHNFVFDKLKETIDFFEEVVKELKDL